jgi:hypothetical protein
VTYFHYFQFITCICTTWFLTTAKLFYQCNYGLRWLWEVPDYGESSKFLVSELHWKFFFLLMETTIWINQYVIHFMSQALIITSATWCYEIDAVDRCPNNFLFLNIVTILKFIALHHL